MALRVLYVVICSQRHLLAAAENSRFEGPDGLFLMQMDSLILASTSVISPLISLFQAKVRPEKLSSDAKASLGNHIMIVACETCFPFLKTSLGNEFPTPRSGKLISHH